MDDSTFKFPKSKMYIANKKNSYNQSNGETPTDHKIIKMTSEMWQL